MHSRRLVPVAAAILVAVAGCDVSRGDSSRDGLLTLSLGEDDPRMGGLPRGTLELDPDRGCVLLSGQAVVWPAGTTLTTDPPEIHLRGGVTARSGDVVSGGGGEIPGATVRETALRIEGDLTHALGCAPKRSQVTVFMARGEDISVSRKD